MSELLVPPPRTLAVSDSDIEASESLHHGTSLVLCLISLASYLIQFAVNVLLARNLTASDFDDYNIAMAIVLTLSTVATLGIEKLALYQLPVLRERRDWNGTQGFLRTARRTILFVSIGLSGLVIVSVESALTALGGNYHLGIPLAVAWLPVIAYGLFLVEVLTAYRRQVMATAVYRILVPSCLLAFNLSWVLQGYSFTAIEAAFTFGVAWVIGTTVLARLFRRTRPAELRTAIAEFRTRKWIKRATPLFIYSLLLTAQGQSGVLVLKHLYPSDPIVSEYAMAFSVGTFIILVATATNRFYLPALSVHLERRDLAGFRYDLRIRRLWVGSVVFSFALAIAYSGDHILALFGGSYLRSYPALVIIVMGTSVAVLFAPAPYVLQFIGANRLVVSTSLITLAATIAGSFYYGAQHGSSGVAASFAGPIIIQFFVLKIMMHRLVERKFAAEANGANHSGSG